MHDLARRTLSKHVHVVLQACNLVLSLVRSLPCSHVLLLVSTLFTARTANSSALLG